MRIRISHPDLVDPLVRALNETDCSAARTGAHAVDVFVPWLRPRRRPAPGADGGAVLRRSWGLAHAGFDVQLA